MLSQVLGMPSHGITKYLQGSQTAPALSRVVRPAGHSTWTGRARPSLHHGSLTGFRGDRQLRPVDRVVACGHDFCVEGHPDHRVGERLRHERKYPGIVVAELVAPTEWVVDTSSVETRDVSLIIADVTAEQVDLLLALAAILTCQHTVSGNSRRVEAERVGSDRGE